MFVRRPYSKATRRQVIAGVAASFAHAVTSRHALSLPGDFESDPFSLGVASGDPSHNSIVLWTRLAPNPLEADGGLSLPNIPVEWVVASDEKMGQIVSRGSITARRESGYSLHVPVEGLRPRRHYWYQFRTKGYISPIGRSKTLPDPSDPINQFKIAVGGCQKISDGFYTAWADLAKTDLDLVFHYGDYIYEHGIASAVISARLGRELPDQGPKRLRSLDDYRRRYALYKLDADLSAAHAMHPFIATFDDHEVVNNWSGGDPRYSRLSKAALQAFFENMPVHPKRMSGGGIIMYRDFRIGDLIHFPVLDTRQYRSPQACGLKGIRARCDERRDPSRTMLGAEQERWVDQIIVESDTTWTVLGSQVMMMQERFESSQQHDAPVDNDSAITGTDKWDGYSAARSRLLERCANRGKNGVIVLSGDRHVSMAGNLTLDFDDPRSPVVGVELVATSISSGRNGRAGGRQIRRLNPHMKFVDRRRGSLICTFEHRSLEAEFRATDIVDKPGFPVRAIKTIRIDPRHISL